MSGVPPDLTATAVVDALLARRSEAELATVRRRLAPDEPAIGMRMKDVFDVSRAHTDLPLSEVQALLREPTYEARLAAFCVLDFQVRRALSDPERHARMRLYLDRHDRITTWDMVDRAAPRVVGGYLLGRAKEPLDELAAAAEPLRRRTAITAPLMFVRAGDDADLAAGFAVAGRLAADPEPVVHKAVGIFLKHAGGRDSDALQRFLADYGTALPRAALREAVAKLPPVERRRYVG